MKYVRKMHVSPEMLWGFLTLRVAATSVQGFPEDGEIIGAEWKADGFGCITLDVATTEPGGDITPLYRRVEVCA